MDHPELKTLSTSQIRNLAFGIVIDDIVMPDGTTYNHVLGGGGPQTAWGMAAASGGGAAVGLVALVGSDLTPAMLEPMTNAGVNLDGVRRGDGLTPRAFQQMDAQGGRTHVWTVPPPPPEVHFPSDWSRLPETYRSAERFHWGLHPENPRLNFAHTLTGEGRSVSLETFKPPDEPLSDAALRDLLSACRVFSPNWHEVVGITGSADYPTVLRRLRVHGGQILALRRGEQGADVWDLTRGVGVRVPAIPTTVVDTVGAGNAFCGALLVRLEDGLTVAAAHGVAAASFLVEQVGLPLTLPAPAASQQRVQYALDRAVPLHLSD